MCQKNDKDQKFETASATTDPDNANSGPTAYIIVAIALGVILIGGLLTAGCVSFVVFGAINNHAEAQNPFATLPNGTGQTTPLPFEDDSGDLDSLEDLFDQYEREFGTGSGGTSNDQGRSSTSATDAVSALEFDLAPYGQNIDNAVSASSYAGTSTAVRDFVRGLVGKDSEYTKQVVSLMRTYAAATSDKKDSEDLTKAIGICDEAIKTFEGLELPKIDKDSNGAVADLFGSAKSESAERWKQIKAELELLNTKDNIDTRKLWRIDDEIVDATDDAAELLMDAMERSTKL